MTMTNKLLSLFFTLFMFLGSTDVAAQTTRYYRNCDAGAHASCVNGNDANPGTSPSAPRRTLPDDTAFNALAAGSNIRICNGSSWVSGAGTAPPIFIAQNANATRTSPITMEGYNCGDGASGRPILQYASGASLAFNVGGFCSGTCPAPYHGGYVFRGFRVTKGGALATGSEAVAIFGSSRWVLFEDMEFDNWANAFNIATDQNNRDLTFRSNYIHDNAQNGIVGAATDLVIEKNLLVRNNRLDNGSGSYALEHALYIGGATPQQRIVIRGNILTDNSTNQGTQQCESGNITFRGNVDQVTIEENVITVPGATPTCYGISIIDGYGTNEECVRRATIRGNTIVNVGGTAMALLLTQGGLVENNKIIRTITTGQGAGISIGNPSDPGDATYCPMGNMTVRNNSVYFATASVGAGISITAGTGHQVFNNAVYANASSSFQCFGHSAFGNFTLWNYNWCSNVGGGNWSSTYANLGLAQVAGFDTNGGNTAIGFPVPSSGNSWSLEPGANLRSVGRNTGKPRFDAKWCQRDSTPDVGAEEFGASPCLTVRAPLGLNQ